jgi:adenosylhomocysteine nucleosidase
MMLRWLLASYAHQMTRQKIQETVTQAWQQVSGQSEARRPGDLPPCDVALVLSTEAEAEGLAKRLDGKVTMRCATYVEHAGRWCDRRVVVAECGLGAPAVERAVADVIAIHHPAWVVSTGFAAALAGHLRRGHVLMADRVVDSERREWTVGLKLDPRVLAETKGLHVGRLLSIDRLVHDPKQKLALGQAYAALACDMETKAVAELCQREKVRFLSVRVISDAVDDRWPPEIEALLDQRSWAGKLGAATGAMWKRPAWLKDLLQLQGQAELASNRLAQFCGGVIPQLER